MNGMDRPSMASHESDVGLAPSYKSQHVYSTHSIDKPFIYENRIEDDVADSHSRYRLARNHTLWPSLIACIPMVLLCAGLLALIFSYQITPMASVFSPSLTTDEYYKAGYLLVNFSDTKIVFLASFLSTLAPMLAGCLMSLASISLVRKYYALPRTYRMSSTSASDQHEILSGLFSASYGPLVSSCKWLIRKRNTKMPPIVFYATVLLLLTIFMSIAVAIADAALHVFTKTVNFTLYAPQTSPTYQHGRGLNSLCLNFDRVKQNYGFPCTNQMNPDFVDPDAYAEAAESQKLAHNASALQEIRFFNATSTDHSDLVYLIPEYTTIDPNLDYKATTVGVSSQCSLIPAHRCNLTRWGPYDEAYTSFNCSKNFWGTLGLAQNATPINSYRQPSIYLPLLSIKPQSNLQYGFYNDPELYSIYNPAGLNDSSLPDPNLQPVPDERLPTSLYWAFAWRSSWGIFVGGEDNEMISSNLTGVYPGIYYLDFFLNCKITALDVEYAWVNGTVDPSSIVATTMSNGTALNMWQGTVTYGPSISGGGHIVQDIHAQAAVAGTTISSYESRFGALLGQQVLAVIGGYTSSRTVQQQQMRQELLLAKIPKASLGALVGCSLLYPVMALILLLKARRSLREESKLTQTTRTCRPTQQFYRNIPATSMMKQMSLSSSTPAPTIGAAIPMMRSPTSTISKSQHHQNSVRDKFYPPPPPPPPPPELFTFNDALDPGSVWNLNTAMPLSTQQDRKSPSTPRARDRNSTAGFRSALWGSAGAGPNFDHLRSDESDGGHIM